MNLIEKILRLNVWKEKGKRSQEQSEKFEIVKGQWFHAGFQQYELEIKVIKTR